MVMLRLRMALLVEGVPLRFQLSTGFANSLFQMWIHLMRKELAMAPHMAQQSSNKDEPAKLVPELVLQGMLHHAEMFIKQLIHPLTSRHSAIQRASTTLL